MKNITMKSRQKINLSLQLVKYIVINLKFPNEHSVVF